MATYFLYPSAKINLTSLSIPTNLSLSFGSSFFTSSEWMNKFSKNVQDLYTSAKIYTISAIAAKLFYQYTHLSSKVDRYLEENIAVTAT